jgi:hypothetical protein
LLQGWRKHMSRATPAKGKARVKVTSSGRKVS